jgi:NAD(P)-dependent dehydrogenase (short-subunit alcohol dehydrogenase family)
MPKDTPAKELQKMVLDTPMEEFNNVFAVNVTGVLYNAVAFLDLLEEGNKQGNMAGVKSQVLVTGSIAAYNRNVGAGLAYNTSKAAVTHLVKMLAGLFVEYSVRVNAIAPGRMCPRNSLCNFERADRGHSLPIGAICALITGKRRNKRRRLSQMLHSTRKDW